MSREFNVFTTSEQEDLTWQLAWVLSNSAHTDDAWRKDWLDYDGEIGGVSFNPDGYSDVPFGVFRYEPDNTRQKRTVSYILEWAFAGHAPSQRAFNAFTQAMLGIQDETSGEEL